MYGFENYTGVAKGLKLKFKKFFWANSNVCRSYRGKTGKGTFYTRILNRVETVQHLIVQYYNSNTIAITVATSVTVTSAVVQYERVE